MPVANGNKHANVAYIFSNFLHTRDQDHLKYQSYQIQGSKLSKEMECKEDENGAITCELPEQVIHYRVEDLSTHKEIIDDHMASTFGEGSIFSYFAELHKDHTHKKEIEKAVENYNQMLSKLIAQNSVHDIVLKDINLDYDVFNIANFYEFCKKSPDEYPFVLNERTPELDEIIIGFWLKKHHA